MDKDMKIIGYYNLTDVVSVFIDTPFLQNPVVFW